MKDRFDVSSFTLKIIAILGMTCNHAAYIFADQLPFSIYCIMEGVGGLTFPTMAFLLAEGFRHTSNVWRYTMRLAIFALIAQIPFSLFLGSGLDVLFTLLIGLILLQLNKTMTNRPLYYLIAVILTLVSSICDWGFIGVIMILIAGLMPTQKQQALYSSLLPGLVFGIPSLLYLLAGNVNYAGELLYAIGCVVAGLLLCLYRGRRGRSLKWFFYVYYPLHISVLGIISLVI